MMPAREEDRSRRPARRRRRSCRPRSPARRRAAARSITKADQAQARRRRLAEALRLRRRLEGEAAHEQLDGASPKLHRLQPGPVRPDRDREVRLARLHRTPNGSFVSATTGVFRDAGDGEDGVRARRSPGSSRKCFGELLEKSTAEGTKVYAAGPLELPEGRRPLERVPAGRVGSRRRSRHVQVDDRLRALQQGHAPTWRSSSSAIGEAAPGRARAAGGRARRLAR